MRALVEDHGGGQCLHRVAIWSRPTAAAAPLVFVAAGADLALHYAGLSWLVSAAIVGVLMLGVATASLLATGGVVLNALGAVADSLGMTVVPSPDRAERGGQGTADAPVQPAGLALISREMTDVPNNSRVMVGDS